MVSDLLVLAAVFVTPVVAVAAHEAFHGLALRYFGYSHSYHVGVDPNMSESRVSFLFVAAWVSYDPWRAEATGREVAAVALAPLLLFAPYLLVPVGLVPSPLWFLSAPEGATASAAEVVATFWAFAGLLSPPDLYEAYVGLREWDDTVSGVREARTRHAAVEGAEVVA